MAFFIFVLLFGIYLRTAPPTIVAYRDSSELIASAATLGIAHPSGYPLYVILGKIFTNIIPFGNIAYRINIMSVVFSGLTIVLLYYAILLVLAQQAAYWTKAISPGAHSNAPQNAPSITPPNAPHSVSEDLLFEHRLAAIFSVLFLSFNPVFWNLSLVAEMYTLNSFLTILLILVVLSWHLRTSAGTPTSSVHLYLFCFIFGVGLGNHLTLLFLLPGVVYLILKTLRGVSTFFSRPNGQQIAVASLFFLLGLSIYLYLPIRSYQQPVINWGSPHNFTNFIEVITRKNIGAFQLTIEAAPFQFSLEQLIRQSLVFFNSTVQHFTIIGFLLGLFGLMFFIFKRQGHITLFFLLIFLFSGIGFLVLAGQPTDDQHAQAILEPYYLLPGIIFSIWLGIGIVGIKRLFATPSKIFSYFVILILLFALLFQFKSVFYKVNKRNHFFAYDYGLNFFRTIDKNAIVITHGDTPLFTSWYFQRVLKKRQDINIFSEGLRFAKWYIQQKSKDMPADVKSFIALPRVDPARELIVGYLNGYFKSSGFSLYANSLLTFPGYIIDRSHPFRGIVFGFSPEPESVSAHTIQENLKFWDIYIMRGIYEQRPEKRFAPGPNGKSPAEKHPPRHPRDFFISEITNAYSSAHGAHGFLLYNRKLYNEAIEQFWESIIIEPQNIKGWTDLGSVYYTIGDYPRAIQLYKYALSMYPDNDEVYYNLGRVYEKIGSKAIAIENYTRAININPRCVKSYNNLGVIYYNKGMYEKALSYWKSAIDIAPDFADARRNYEICLKKMDAIR
ncbi:MAG: DUF2723 domain-containing protein [Elusimicrobia bacterium]|nr:DUF2723 domain-containing protein [Elusimicrobiota bacterium]